MSKTLCKVFTILCLTIVVSGCQSVTTRNVANEWYIGNLKKVGNASYDPPNGDWIFIRNEPGGAIQGAKRTQNWTWNEKGIPPVY